jgi:hypothetical protein
MESDRNREVSPVTVHDRVISHPMNLTRVQDNSEPILTPSYECMRMATLIIRKRMMGGGDIGDDDYDKIFDRYGDHDMKKKWEEEKKRNI